MKVAGKPPLDEIADHGGSLSRADRLFPAAPKPWLDLSTGINPHSYRFADLTESAFRRLPETAQLSQLLDAAARAYATTPRAALVYCLGVTQHVCGTENVIALSNLALATGHVGMAGAGINPLRGQDNVQGACDMGALPDVLSGYQAVADPSARARFAVAWGGAELSGRPGLTSLAMQHAALEGRVYNCNVLN